MIQATSVVVDMIGPFFAYYKDHGAQSTAIDLMTTK